MDLLTRELWTIEMLGGLRVHKGGASIARFETRRAAALLARLAFYIHRSHPREELIEMLWPDEDIDVTRLRFRQVLTTLRRTLETLGTPADALLIADRSAVQLSPGAASTDVLLFENTLRSAEKAEDAPRRAQWLSAAIDMYRGELLPGFYDDWVLSERQRLADSYVAALWRLAGTLVEMGTPAGACTWGEKAVAADPFREESHCELMRLYVSTGRVPDALRQYRELEHVLWKEFRSTPAASTQALADQIRTSTNQPVARLPHDPYLSSPESGSPANPSGALPLSPDTEHTLPIPFSRFFGREDELARLQRALSPIHLSPHSNRNLKESRLITLTGPGGCGKSRLALEVARQLRADYQNAVWFVPLASIGNPRHIAASIAEAVTSDAVEGQDPRQRICHGIGSRPALLVLDNFEQVVDGGALIVTWLLESMPALRCLITSRSLLNLEGEQEFTVPPLPVPTSGGDASPTTASMTPDCASVEMFVDRVQKGRMNFALTPENREAVLELCRRLEGIPLAIELAAAWSSALSPQQMLDRLSKRFELLVSRRKDIPERHHSLWTTIEWSYGQLSPSLQSLFLTLSVFRGGWTFEAAEAVAFQEENAPAGAAGSVSVSSSILENLEQLRSHSLILSEASGSEMRFRMLETLREFGLHTLAEGERSALRKRHARYFMALAESAEPNLVGPDQIEWLDRLAAELDNLREALAWATGPEGEIEVGLCILAAIFRYWNSRLNQTEIDHFLDVLIPRVSDAPALLRARVLEAASNLASRLKREQSLAWSDESLALYRSLEHPLGVARILHLQGVVYGFMGQTERANSLLLESRGILEKLNDNRTLALVLGALGNVAKISGDYTVAASLLERAVAMHRIAGNKQAMSWCLFMLAHTSMEQNDYGAAMPMFEDVLARFRDLDYRFWIQATLFNIGNIHQANGNMVGAQAACDEALLIARSLGEPHTQATHLVWSGDLACRDRDYPLARQFYREALQISQQAELSFAYYRLFRRFACLAAAMGNPSRAVRLFAAAECQDQSRFLEVPQSIPLATLTTPEALRAEIGDEPFHADWLAGQRMSLEQMISYALYER